MREVLRDLLVTTLPVVVAILTTVLMELLQRLLAWLERWPAPIKRLAVVVLSFTLTRGAHALGVPLLSTDITALQDVDASALLSGALAYVFHLGDRARRR